MKSSKDFADLLQMIQDKRNDYQRHGTPYDDAETRLSEQETKHDAQDETNPTTEL
jgi:hypothetical protein